MSDLPPPGKPRRDPDGSTLGGEPLRGALPPDPPLPKAAFFAEHKAMVDQKRDHLARLGMDERHVAALRMPERHEAPIEPVSKPNVALPADVPEDAPKKAPRGELFRGDLEE